jgi:hypothetical protein
VRKGFEKNDKEISDAMQEKYKREIYDNIDGYQDHLKRLQDE